MATKPAKKKAAKSASPSQSGAAKATRPAAAMSSAVIPFSPISADTLRKFTPSTSSFESAFGSMEPLMKNYKEQVEKMSDDASNTMRQTMESCAKTSSSFAKGAEQMVKTIAELAQESSQRNAESLKALMACRTLNEFAEAQNKLIQQNLDDAMTTATKLSEMAIKICSEAVEPINGTMTKAMKKMSESMAA